MDSAVDRAFIGSIPELYNSQMVPLIFECYAADLAARLSSRPLSRLLEIAAGTGALTRALASTLASNVSITATDLNRAMLDHAAATGTKRPVEWRVADVMSLPFEDAAFDAVVCQFGAMFFPDKPAAFAEARRVLKSGGVFVFSVWDRIEENEFANVVTTALESLFPDDPPRFLARTPHGYFDSYVIEHDLRRAGFDAAPQIITIAQRSRASSARIPAFAYCQGTPLKAEIERQDAANPALLNEATDVAERAIAERFGRGVVDGKIQAHLVSVEG
jgi:ubiquinone/menaquinone biosynthesis C-methylase UbiE